VDKALKNMSTDLYQSVYDSTLPLWDDKDTLTWDDLKPVITTIWRTEGLNV
jgi:hypothetical protein